MNSVQPATKWQQWFVSTHLDSACSKEFCDYWILANAYLIRPSVDHRRLKRAFEKLFQRHDILRTRFDHNHGKTQVVIQDLNSHPFQIEDAGNMTDADFKTRIFEIARAPMPILSEKLAEIILVKCGERGDVLITRFHHALTDGFGVTVLAEDLLKFILGIPVISRTVSHQEYISKWEVKSGLQLEQTNEYWRKVLADYPIAPMVGRKAKGLEPLVNSVGLKKTCGLVVSLSESSLAALKKRARKNNMSASTAISAGFYEAVCLNYGLEEVAFLSVRSRSEHGLNNFGGYHTAIPTMRYKIDRESNWDCRATQLQKNLNEVLDFLPSDAATRGTKTEQELIERGGYPAQFIAQSPAAKARERASFFGTSLSFKVAEPQRIGPFEITMLDVESAVTGINELGVSPSPEGENPGFSIGFDAVAYDEPEIAALARQASDILDVEIEEFKAT